MNGLPYYKAYPRDFIEGTIGMSFELKGAYRLVLDIIYLRGGHLPDDCRAIAGMLGCSVRKWKALRDDLVSLGKIQHQNGIISNFRADKELVILRSYQDKQSEIASKPRKNKGLQQPEPSHTEPEPDKKEGASLPTRAQDNDAFDTFWSMYPNKVGKADAKKAWEKARRRVTVEALFAGLYRYVNKTDDRKWCNPATWLNQDRWLDQPAADPQSFLDQLNQLGDNGHGDSRANHRRDAGGFLAGKGSEHEDDSVPLFIPYEGKRH